MPKRDRAPTAADEERATTPPLDLDEEEADRGGTVPGGGLGGNRLTDMSTPAGYVTDEDLSPGQRRRGGESVLPRRRRLPEE